MLPVNGAAYNGSSSYNFICIATLPITSANAGSADFTGFTLLPSGTVTNPTKGTTVVLLDYAESSIGSSGNPPTVEASSAVAASYGTNQITAPAVTPCGTCLSDEIITVFAASTSGHPPYWCPSALKKRFDNLTINSSNPPEIFICDVQLSSTTVPSLQMANPMGAGIAVVGATIALHAN